MVARTPTGESIMTGFNSPADVNAIMEIEKTLAEFHPMSKLIDYYADDAIALDVYDPGIYRGKDEIYRGFEEGVQHIEDFKGDIADINILTNGTFAGAALQVRFQVTLKGGQELNIQLRQLDAFKKINGKWQIVQQHISFPMDPKTGLGVMNGPLPIRGPIQWPQNPLPGPQVSPEQARQEIHDFLETGVMVPDVDALMRYYGPTDDVLVYDVLHPPGEFRGLKETRDGFAAVMNFTDPQVKMLELVVDSDGVFGIQLDVQDITVTEKNGSRRNFMLRQSDILRRVDGKWYTVFEALSMPIDPKTGLAVSNPASFKQR
jgi:ketosteroid isomerase-like protein